MYNKGFFVQDGLFDLNINQNLCQKGKKQKWIKPELGPVPYKHINDKRHICMAAGRPCNLNCQIWH